MDPFNRPTSITYRRWINPELRDEVDLEGHSDETQSTDTEICTITSPRITQSASSYGATKPEETFTVEDALESIGFGIFQWKMSFITGLSWIADAMEMMILSVLAPQLHCEWRLPSYQTALITSIVFVGMGLSSSVWGNFADKYGRKTSLFVCMSWTLYYGLLSAFTPVYSWLLVLRGLVGLGVGGAPQSVTLYSEFLPAKARGTCIMLIAAFWAIGTMFEVLLALWIMPVLGWRWLLGFSTLPMALFLCFCIWLPESPRFDVLTGKREKAVATLAYIAKQNGKAMPRGQLVAYQQKDRGRLKDLFNPEYCRTTLLLWFIWFANTFCYYGVILLTTEILQAGDLCGAIQGAKIEPSCSLECKYLTTADYKDLLYTTLAEFPGLLLIIFVIEYLGRKKSMALCFFIFSLFILPLYACIGRTAFTIVIFIARGIIAAGFQVVYVYTPEGSVFIHGYWIMFASLLHILRVFPTENRALAVGIASAMAKVGALITPFVAQVMLRVSVNLTLALYCGCSVLAGVACLMLPIETLGRALQESSSNQEARSARATVSTIQESQFNETI